MCIAHEMKNKIKKKSTFWILWFSTWREPKICIYKNSVAHEFRSEGKKHQKIQNFQNFKVFDVQETQKLFAKQTFLSRKRVKKRKGKKMIISKLLKCRRNQKKNLIKIGFESYSKSEAKKNSNSRNFKVPDVQAKQKNIFYFGCTLV